MSEWSSPPLPNGPEPLVSVIVPTFNHGRFLTRALEGILEQDAGFPFEILVGDDASTDETPAILAQIAVAHPRQIRAFFATRNQGGHQNFSNLYAAARGRYVAWLEGDDYWTDPAKLRLQVDFLEAHPEAVLSFHPVAIVDDAGAVHCASTNGSDPEWSGLERISRFNYIHTGSVLFRNRIVPDLPHWVRSLPLGDWPLFLLLAEHGRLALLRRTMAVYRLHGGGVWSSQSEVGRLEKTVHVAEVCLRELGHPGLHDCLFKTSRSIVRLALASGQIGKASAYSLKCLRALCSNPRIAQHFWRRRARKP